MDDMVVVFLLRGMMEMSTMHPVHRGGGEREESIFVGAAHNVGQR